MMGMFLVEEFRYREAKPHLRAFLQQVPNYAPALAAMGRAQLETGEVDAARKSIADALRADPTNGEARALRERFRDR